MKNRYFWLIIVVIIIALAGAAFYYYEQGKPRQTEVVFLDVGQGDSILIKTPLGQNILVDGGPDRSVLPALARNLSWWDKTIDLAVLTHPDDDHSAGLALAAERFNIRRFAYTGLVDYSPSYTALLATVKRKNISAVLIERPQTIDLGGKLFLEVLWPRENLSGRTAENSNDTSIVLRLVDGNNRFLFLGDLEAAGERSLEAAAPDALAARTVKISHHGSDNSSSEEFLARVAPEFAVISVGEGNKFGHPSRRVLKRLERLGARILRTDRQGDLHFKSDGRGLSIKTGK